jgi:hypothetical protein
MQNGSYTIPYLRPNGGLRWGKMLPFGLRWGKMLLCGLRWGKMFKLQYTCNDMISMQNGSYTIPYLRPNGNIWPHLRPNGYTVPHLRPNGNIWPHLRPNGYNHKLDKYRKATHIPFPPVWYINGRWRRVWRYEKGNQNTYIEEQTTQWPKEKSTKGHLSMIKSEYNNIT